MENSFISITPMSTLTLSGSPVKDPSMGKIEMFDHVIARKFMTDIKLSCKCYISIFVTI